jgi:hypothetical protein
MASLAVLVAASHALSNPLPSLGACVSQPRGKHAISAELVVSLVETYCSSLGEDAAVSVTVSMKTGKDKSVIFKYDPARDEILPSISVRGNSIIVSIAEISTIIDRRERFGPYRIIYNIGKIDYP